MNSEIKIDTVQLRFHREFLQEERRIALELTDRLEHVKNLAGDELYDSVSTLIRSADNLANYCASMSDGLDEVSDIFDDVSRRMSSILTDYIECALSGAE